MTGLTSVWCLSGNVTNIATGAAIGAGQNEMAEQTSVPTEWSAQSDGSVYESMGIPKDRPE